jgi:ABC-type uncharacterized transport system fused permease/ATPase subunit
VSEQLLHEFRPLLMSQQAAEMEEEEEEHDHNTLTRQLKKCKTTVPEQRQQEDIKHLIDAQDETFTAVRAADGSVHVKVRFILKISTCATLTNSLLTSLSADPTWTGRELSATSGVCGHNA